jgi:Asp-tRNA(Asn)/Glu-tRNA(Gln) amidotransferase A subunit family amidase
VKGFELYHRVEGILHGKYESGNFFELHSQHVQISIPCATVEGCPVGLGIVGPRGSDEALLEAAQLIFPMLNSTLKA